MGGMARWGGAGPRRWGAGRVGRGPGGGEGPGKGWAWRGWEGRVGHGAYMSWYIMAKGP